MRVYEYGVVVQGPSDPTPQGLRLFATDELPIFSRTALTVADEEGESLTERIIKVLIPTHAHKNVDFYEEKDTNYVLRASAHHFVNLAVLYSDHTQLVEARERERERKGHRDAVQVNLDDPRVFFETDAFLGTARRFYEQLRRVLWKHYGKSEQRPSDNRWAMAVRLPENPEASSRLAFQFESGPDAMSYCYDTLTHLTAVAAETHSILGIT